MTTLARKAKLSKKAKISRTNRMVKKTKTGEISKMENKSP